MSVASLSKSFSYQLYCTKKFPLSFSSIKLKKCDNRNLFTQKKDIPSQKYENINKYQLYGFHRSGNISISTFNQLSKFSTNSNNSKDNSNLEDKKQDYESKSDQSSKNNSNISHVDIEKPSLLVLSANLLLLGLGITSVYYGYQNHEEIAKRVWKELPTDPMGLKSYVTYYIYKLYDKWDDWVAYRKETKMIRRNFMKEDEPLNILDVYADRVAFYHMKQIDPTSPTFKPYTIALDTDLFLAEMNDYIRGPTYRRRAGIDAFWEGVRLLPFEVVMYSKETYARGSMKMMDEEATLESDYWGGIDHRLWREHMFYCEGNWVKDSRVLDRRPERLIIFDTNPINAEFVHNRGNVVLVPEWDGNVNDYVLLKMLEFLKSLATLQPDDVRPYLSKCNLDGTGVTSEERLPFEQRPAFLQNSLHHPHRTHPYTPHVLYKDGHPEAPLYKKKKKTIITPPQQQNTTTTRQHSH